MTDYYHINFQEYHDRTFSIDPTLILSPLVKLLDPYSRILDVGCGSGRDLLWLKKRGFKVTGFERSSRLAKLAIKNVGCRIIEGDFRYFNYSQLTMDAVTLIGSLVHTSYDALQPIFENILKAVPSGYVLISMKEGAGVTSDLQERTFYLWTDTDLRKLFNKMGLKIVHHFKQPSSITGGVVWLGYVLKNQKG